MARTVTLHLDQLDIQQAQALPYLLSWAFQSYSVINIFPDGGRDLIAVFTNPATQDKYVIGAVWHEDRQQYSYHS